MEFRYSSRIRRFIFDIIIAMAFMEPYLLISGKYISNNTASWILNFVMLFIVFKLTASIVTVLESRFHCFTKKGLCQIGEDRFVLHLGKGIYEFNTSSDVEELIYMQANRYKKLLGTDWDKLEICKNGKRIVMLAKPDEKESELTNKELYKVFSMIKAACDLIRDADTYAGDFIECYKSRIY